MRAAIGHRLSAFNSRDYRLFFVGQVLSLNGTWAHQIAEAWLVYELTGSILAMGFIRFLHTIPVTALTLQGGKLADKYQKRRILQITQSASMALALALFALAATGAAQLWHIGLVAIGLGLAHAFDIPARQSLIIEMVGKKDLLNAITINSTIFNGARMIGPMLAALLMGVGGAALCFLFNGLSFAASIAAYTRIRAGRERLARNRNHQSNNKEALRFCLETPRIRQTLIMILTCSLFVTPYAVIAPAYVDNALGGTSDDFGRLMAANGAGAFLGSLILIMMAPTRRTHASMALAGIGLSVSLAGLSLAPSQGVAMGAGALVGVFMIILFSTANSLTQIGTPDELRGRIMGIYSFTFIGLSPFGALAVSQIAEMTDTRVAMAAGSAILILVSVWSLSRFVGEAPKPATHS